MHFILWKIFVLSQRIADNVLFQLAKNMVMGVPIAKRCRTSKGSFIEGFLKADRLQANCSSIFYPLRSDSRLVNHFKQPILTHFFFLFFFLQKSIESIRSFMDKYLVIKSYIWNLLNQYYLINFSTKWVELDDDVLRQQCGSGIHFTYQLVQIHFVEPNQNCSAVHLWANTHHHLISH